jgi:hypothetical protein
MNAIEIRVLRIILKEGFIWYDVTVEEEFNFSYFVTECLNRGCISFENDQIQLYVPMSELKSMFVFKVNNKVKLNVVNFPERPPCEPPKAS